MGMYMKVLLHWSQTVFEGSLSTVHIICSTYIYCYHTSLAWLATTKSCFTYRYPCVNSIQSLVYQTWMNMQIWYSYLCNLGPLSQIKPLSVKDLSSFIHYYSNAYISVQWRTIQHTYSYRRYLSSWFVHGNERFNTSIHLLRNYRI